MLIDSCSINGKHYVRKVTGVDSCEGCCATEGDELCCAFGDCHESIFVERGDAHQARLEAAEDRDNGKV